MLFEFLSENGWLIFFKKSKRNNTLMIINWTANKTIQAKV